jgi:polysaccharide deacetylase 2 family uncharacterized protein YibQ
MECSRIQELIRRCAVDALKRGHLIVGSKATPAFMRALKSELPFLRQHGITLSYVSEIAAPAGENNQ